MLGALVGSGAKGVADYLVAKKQTDTQAVAAARLVRQEIETTKTLVTDAIRNKNKGGLDLPREEWDVRREILARYVQGDDWRSLYLWYAMVTYFNMLDSDAAIGDETSNSLNRLLDEAAAALERAIPSAS